VAVGGTPLGGRIALPQAVRARHICQAAAQNRRTAPPHADDRPCRHRVCWASVIHRPDVRYNAVLRGLQIPAFSARLETLCQGNKYTDTIHAINSGMLKLSKTTSAHTLYRGMAGLRLPDDFVAPDEYGIAGGVECGFMSATTDAQVAQEYASGSRAGVLYEIQQGLSDRGADLCWLSQYPHEQEICFPPMTGLTVHTRNGVPAKRIVGAVTVVELQPSVARSGIVQDESAVEELTEAVASASRQALAAATALQKEKTAARRAEKERMASERQRAEAVAEAETLGKELRQAKAAKAAAEAATAVARRAASALAKAGTPETAPATSGLQRAGSQKALAAAVAPEAKAAMKRRVPTKKRLTAGTAEAPQPAADATTPETQVKADAGQADVDEASTKEQTNDSTEVAACPAAIGLSGEAASPEQASIPIQARVRSSFMAARYRKEMKARRAAAVVLQAGYRGHQGRSQAAHSRMAEAAAAARLQARMRGRIERGRRMAAPEANAMDGGPPTTTSEVDDVKNALDEPPAAAVPAASSAATADPFRASHYEGNGLVKVGPIAWIASTMAVAPLDSKEQMQDEIPDPVLPPETAAPATLPTACVQLAIGTNGEARAHIDIRASL